MITQNNGLFMNKKVAVIIPCLNEENTIADVVFGFRRSLPGIPIYVYDNNSTDRTAKFADIAGAIVRKSPVPGKGNVIKQMVKEIDADYYIMIDGDGTYSPKDAPKMLTNAIQDNVAMVIGDRLTTTYFKETKNPCNKLGNKFIKFVLNWMYPWGNVTEVLSGYRVISKKFFEKHPIQSDGFEVETEMTINLIKNMEFTFEFLPVHYQSRPEGSHSKIKVFSDSIRILKAIKRFSKTDRRITDNGRR